MMTVRKCSQLYLDIYTQRLIQHVLRYMCTECKTARCRTARNRAVKIKRSNSIQVARRKDQDTLLKVLVELELVYLVKDVLAIIAAHSSLRLAGCSRWYRAGKPKYHGDPKLSISASFLVCAYHVSSI